MPETTQQSWDASYKSRVSEKKLPEQFLLKQILQPIEACTSLSQFVKLSFIIFFLGSRIFFSHDTTYGFLLPLDFIWHLSTLHKTAISLNNLFSHLQGYFQFCNGNSSLRNKAYHKYRLFNHFLSCLVDKSYADLEKGCIQKGYSYCLNILITPSVITKPHHMPEILILYYHFHTKKT